MKGKNLPKRSIYQKFSLNLQRYVCVTMDISVKNAKDNNNKALRSYESEKFNQPYDTYLRQKHLKACC